MILQNELMAKIDESTDCLCIMAKVEPSKFHMFSLQMAEKFGQYFLAGQDHGLGGGDKQQMSGKYAGGGFHHRATANPTMARRGGGGHGGEQKKQPKERQ